MPPIITGPITPTLNPIAASTTLNPFTITGSAARNVDVRLYVNGGEYQAVIRSSAIDGSFSFKAALYDGANSIYATVWDGTSESPASNTLSITYTNNISRIQGGTISVDTVWTPGTANTPYLISSTLYVYWGAKLTLQPGTELQFGPGTSLVVYESLVIRGSPTLRVKLSTSDPGGWGGVDVRGGAVIDNATIEFAANGVKYGPNSSGSVSNCVISNNTNGILVTSNAAPKIGPGNVITANTVGLYVDGYHSSNIPNPNPLVTGNDIYGNSKYNLYTYGFYNPSTAILDARYNWWGSKYRDAISKTIITYTNPIYSPNYSAQVNYGGYLDGPGGVPVLPNTLFINSITSDMTLEANTTYELLGQVVVPVGVTLTILEGVTLRSQAGSLLVMGALIVKGTSAAPVTFTSIQTPTSNYWNGISVSYTATKVVIDHAVIGYGWVTFNALTVDGGDCLTMCVKNSALNSAGVGIGSGANATIQNNNFMIGNSISVSGSGLVLNNTIQNAANGISITGGSPLIKGNTITNSTNGLYITGGTPVITNGNVITGNQKGIYTYGGYGPGGRPLINGNSIYANTSNYYAQGYYSNGTAGSVVLDAKNNWWGNVDPATISGKIYDYTDSSYYNPVVDFSDFLQSENGPPVVNNYLTAILQDRTLSTNTTYVVLGNLRVAAGKTLTIPSGAVMQFPDLYKILVEGSLVVQGASNPAIFTSTKALLARGNWQGIEVSSTAAMVVIEGAKIEYADKGVYFKGSAAVDSGTCAVLCVKNSLIQNNTSGLHLSGATNPTLIGNTIINNTYGIYLSGSGSDASSPSAVITGNDIYSNSGAGLYVYNYSTSSGLHINATGNWWGVAAPAAGSDIKFNLASPTSPVVDYSNAATQSLHSLNVPPTIDMTSPTSSAVFYSPAQVMLIANAADSDGTINKVEFYNGTTLLSTATASPYSYAWNNVTAGIYTLSAIATDNNGAQSTSASATVTVGSNAPPIVALTGPVSESVYYAPATIAFSATAEDSDGSIAMVEFYNGTILLGAATNPPYRFDWNNVTVGSYTISAKATDNLGSVTTSSPISITVTNLAITIAAPANDATLLGNTTPVTGSIQAPNNAGVAINGVCAALDANNTFYANVPLSAGSNTLTATVTTLDGQSDSQEITVYRYSATPVIQISADTLEDVAPLVVPVTIVNTGVNVATVKWNGSGNYNLQAGQTLVLTTTYATPGNYPVTITATDTQGAITTQSYVFAAYDASKLDLKVQGLWNGMNTALVAGDKPLAMKYLSGIAQKKYGPVFDALLPNMPQILSTFSPLQRSVVKAEYGEYAVNRTIDGVNQLYLTYFIRGADCVWRLDSM